MSNRILRIKEVTERIGLGRTALYNRVGQGLFPAPCKLGPRASGWPEHEIEAIIDAYIAGKSEREIQELVSQLVVARNKGRAA